MFGKIIEESEIKLPDSIFFTTIFLLIISLIKLSDCK